jgi:hypothetical protein
VAVFPGPSRQVAPLDSASRAGIQVGFDKLDRIKLSDGFVMRFEPYGQYVLPNRAFGI